MKYKVDGALHLKVSSGVSLGALHLKVSSRTANAILIWFSFIVRKATDIIAAINVTATAVLFLFIQLNFFLLSYECNV
jgi:hypothetical protein